MWERIVALAGGPGARIAVFPTAAGQSAALGRTRRRYLDRYGARPFVVPLAPRLAGSDANSAADDPGLAAQVANAGGAFFVGGDQGRITTTLAPRRTAATAPCWPPCGRCTAAAA